MDGVWNANPITCIRPPIHQPMPCHAISYYIILHHSISAHAMIFNTIPSHTIFPSTNTALTIWVLSSCALCSVLLLASCSLYTVHTMVWCAFHNCCTHCWWPGVHFALCASSSGISIIGFWSGSRLSLRNTICFGKGNSNNADQCKVTECNTNINICIFLHSIEVQCNRFLLSICYCQLLNPWR